MEFNTRLTNEDLKKDYESQFDLVNHLILEAQAMISSGRSPKVDTHSENVAVIVVDEEVRKDHIAQIVSEEVSIIGTDLEEETLETTHA